MTDLQVAVVGAGVAGSSAALALARRGVRVGVLEQFTPAGPLGASHGRARIFRLAYADPVYVALTRAALGRWQDLERRTGTSLLTLTGAVDHGDPAQLDLLAAVLRAARVEHERADADAVRRRWPGLRVDRAALVHPDAGRLDAEAAVHALLAAAQDAGAEVRTGVAVHRLEPSGAGVRLTTPDGALTAEHVVVAAGGWTPDLLAGTGVPLPPVRLTQEQPLLLPATDPQVGWPSFIHHAGPGTPHAPEHGGAYGLGGPEGVKVGFHGVGPVVRAAERARDAAVVDAAAAERLAAYARYWLPGVDADAWSAQTCTYATTPTGDFAIGRHGAVTVAAGLSGHGFKFGPVLGELVAAHVLSRGEFPGAADEGAAALLAGTGDRFALPAA